MTLFVCWFVFPLLLGVLALGCGLLLERLAGVNLSGALVLPAGLAVIVVVASFATLTDATAELATPAVLGLAVAGLVLGRPWRTIRRVDPWALAAAIGVFVVFAAPVVLSGKATFAGYFELDDTATWLGITDRLMEHGRSIAGLAPSGYEATLDAYLNRAYPVGSFLPLGLGGGLVGQDLAWVFQPYLAFLAAMMALSLYALIAELVASARIRFVAVFVGSQSALLFGYSLWGGVKEMAAAWVIPLVASLLAPILRERTTPLPALLPLVVACAATLDILSLGGAVWLAPMLVPGLLALAHFQGRLPALRQALTFAVLGAALALPALLSAEEFLRPGFEESLTAESEIGILMGPLSALQFFGIWPAGDIRVDPGALGVTHVLIAVTFAAGLLGMVWAWRRRAWGVILYTAAAVVGTLVITRAGSPWVDAKALAIGSPAPVLAGLLGAAAIARGGRLVGAAVVAATIAGGVLWSNALAYHEVNLAPRDRFAELEQIGERIAGQGPTLMTEYEPFGVRHFLRDGDPEGASEIRRREVLLLDGSQLDKLETADIDEFQLESVLVYRTLVLRSSPVGSRPPSVYRRTWSGRYYDVWQRPERAEVEIAARQPFGSDTQAAAVPRCRELLRFAREARRFGLLLATVERPRVAVSGLSSAQAPATWETDPSDTNALLPRDAGAIELDLAVPSPARYRAWVGGAFRGRLRESVDGRPMGNDRDELSFAGQWVPLGSAQLQAGSHRLKLRYDEGSLHPGGGGEPFPLGPLALAEDTVNRPVTHVEPSAARTLCAKRLDWVEALR